MYFLYYRSLPLWYIKQIYMKTTFWLLLGYIYRFQDKVGQNINVSYSLLTVFLQEHRVQNYSNVFEIFKLALFRGSLSNYLVGPFSKKKSSNMHTVETMGVILSICSKMLFKIFLVFKNRLSLTPKLSYHVTCDLRTKLCFSKIFLVKRYRENC